MKLERLHEYVLPVVATVGGMVAAIYCGKLSGNGQMGTLASMIAISIAVALLLGLRQNIWLLIPVGWVLYGQIPVLPLPFAVRDLTVMTVFASFLALKALKIVRIKPKIEMIDLVLAAMLVYMVTVFLRNPVGVNALGSERVGGRPYFDACVAILAYWVLCRARADQKLTPLLPFFVLAAQGFEMLLNLIAFHIPKTAPLLMEVYTGVDPSNYEASNVWRPQAEETSGRQIYLANFGNALALIGCSLWRPLTLITPIYWWRFIGFMGVCLLIGLSGFRSGIMAVVGYMAISSLVRSRKSDVFVLAMLAIPALGLLAAMQGTVVNLPRPVQRALSFLPGRWDPVVVNDAKGSNQWRFEMWKIMLTEDKYISSKWFGDGFGFSQRQLAAMAAQSRFGEEDQESYMMVGNVHSGPLTTIRYTGYIGLSLFLGLLIKTAMVAWKLARRARGTPYYMLALYLCIPLIYTPFSYVFIFGSFDVALPFAIYSVGLLKMLGNSLDAWDSEQAKNQSTMNRSRDAKRKVDLPVPVLG